MRQAGNTWQDYIIQDPQILLCASSSLATKDRTILVNGFIADFCGETWQKQFSVCNESYFSGKFDLLRVYLIE